MSVMTTDSAMNGESGRQTDNSKICRKQQKCKLTPNREIAQSLAINAKFKQLT